MTSISPMPHRVARLVFDTGQPYDRFRGRYETAVPPAVEHLAGRSAARHARCLQTADLAEFGAFGFVLHWRADISPLMTTAGERRPRTAYLMGSNAIDENIYWQNPALLLYSPLRTLIYVGNDDRTYFAVEQPSTLFASFADPDLVDLGALIDCQLADLLDALGVQETEALRAAELKPVATVSHIPRGAYAVN